MGNWYEKIYKYLVVIQQKIEEIRNCRSELRLPESFQYKEESKSYVYNGSATLKEILTSLQYYAHFNRHESETQDSVSITLNIMGQLFTFILWESQIGPKKVRGKQILIMVQGRRRNIMYKYKDIMPILEEYRDPAALASAMLNALGKKQDEQSSHEIGPKVIRAAAQFLLLTHIAESAIPFQETINEFRERVKNNLLGDSVKNNDIEEKTGRIPMGDKIVRSKLRNISEGNVSFAKAFSKENFPIRSEGGTSRGRTWVLRDIHGSSTGDLSDTDIEDDHNNGEEENDSLRAIKQGSDGIEDIVVEPESRDEKFLDVEDDKNNGEEEENDSERAIKQGSDGIEDIVVEPESRDEKFLDVEDDQNNGEEEEHDSDRAIKQGSDGKEYIVVEAESKDKKCSDVEDEKLVAQTAKMSIK